jgi:hypothetical protein
LVEFLWVSHGIEEGLEWCLPKWIKVKEHETTPGHLFITMEEMEYGQQSNDLDEMTREAKVARVSVGEELGKYIT